MGRLRASIVALLLSELILCAPRAGFAETVIVSVVLNQETKGDFFVVLADDGDFLVPEKDLQAMGFRETGGEASLVEGARHVSLRSIEGLVFSFDEKTLTLKIDAPPGLLPKRTIDFTQKRRVKVHYPNDPGGFLNYGVQYTAGDSFDFQSVDVTGTLGARTGDFLLLTDSTYRKTPDREDFIRLMSNITYDRREALQRAVLGDVFASSGDLGAGINIGGVSFSKVFRIDPYFLRYPLADFTGLLSLPSEVEVYLDGTRIRTEKLSPGEFEIRNLSSYDGAGVVTVVIKDPFGGERRITHPYYFTETLLKKGLHEYSYNAGFLREEFGAESNRYGGPAFSAFHRYGVTDSLTAGVRAEGGEKGMNLGPRATYRLRSAGIVTVSAAGSLREGGRGGAAGQVSHVYQDRRINARVSVRGFTEDYVTAAETGNAGDGERIRFEAGGGAGYGTRGFGSLSFDLNVTEYHGGRERNTGSVSYSRNLGRNARVFLSYRHIKEAASSDEFFVGLTFYPWKDLSVSAGYQREKDTDTETLQVQKNPPVGEGLGFRGTVERKDSPAESATTVNPFVQYNGRFGIYTGEYLGRYRDGGGSGETYRISASGGAGLVGGTLGFSRPINDSFGLVTIDGLEGVRVYRNNQEVGRTDRKGRAFVPNLTSYYENQVSINDRDVPIDYSLSEVARYVSPPLRSGSLIHFEARKFQAITGTLAVRSDGEERPAEFLEIGIDAGEGPTTFPTGKGGEFYLENLRPGAYEAAFDVEGKRCVVRIVIPESDELIVDLGRIVCEADR